MLGLLKTITNKMLPVTSHMRISEARYVVVDTELTGLDERKDSILSIGAVRMTGGRLAVGDAFYRLVNPETEVPAKSVVIHGITPSEVSEKPAIGSVLDEFMRYCGQDILVGHFVSIDLAFLGREAARTKGVAIANHAVDTYSVYEWLKKRRAPECGRDDRRPAIGLYDIVREFGIPVNGAHNALMDAFATAQLFQRLIHLLAKSGVREVEELLRIGDPFKGGDRFGISGEIGNF